MQWERLRPLLPPQRPHTGRPAGDHRSILSAILSVLRTGAPGATSPSGSGRGPARGLGSGAGPRQASGRACSRRDSALLMRQGSSIGRRTTSTAPSSGRTSTLPAPWADRSARRSGAVAGASRPRCTCGPRAGLGRWWWSAPAASAMSRATSEHFSMQGACVAARRDARGAAPHVSSATADTATRPLDDSWRGGTSGPLFSPPRPAPQ